MLQAVLLCATKYWSVIIWKLGVSYVTDRSGLFVCLFFLNCVRWIPHPFDFQTFVEVSFISLLLYIAKPSGPNHLSSFKGFGEVNQVKVFFF